MDAVYRRVALAQMRDENNLKGGNPLWRVRTQFAQPHIDEAWHADRIDTGRISNHGILFSNPGTALDRSAILKHVWGKPTMGRKRLSM